MSRTPSLPNDSGGTAPGHSWTTTPVHSRFHAGGEDYGWKAVDTQKIHQPPLANRTHEMMTEVQHEESKNELKGTDERIQTKREGKKTSTDGRKAFDFSKPVKPADADSLSLPTSFFRRRGLKPRIADTKPIQAQGEEEDDLVNLPSSPLLRQPKWTNDPDELVLPVTPEVDDPENIVEMTPPEEQEMWRKNAERAREKEAQLRAEAMARSSKKHEEEEEEEEEEEVDSDTPPLPSIELKSVRVLPYNIEDGTQVQWTKRMTSAYIAQIRSLALRILKALNSKFNRTMNLWKTTEFERLWNDFN